jgi:hypothetical protein
MAPLHAKASDTRHQPNSKITRDGKAEQTESVSADKEYERSAKRARVSEDIFLMYDPSRFFTYHTITTITSSCPFISREEIYTAQVDKTRGQNDKNVQPLRVSPMW